MWFLYQRSERFLLFLVPISFDVHITNSCIPACFQPLHFLLSGVISFVIKIMLHFAITTFNPVADNQLRCVVIRWDAPLMHWYIYIFIYHCFNMFDMFKLAKTLTHEYLVSCLIPQPRHFSFFIFFFTLHLMLLFIGIFFYLLSRFFAI